LADVEVLDIVNDVFHHHRRSSGATKRTLSFALRGLGGSAINADVDAVVELSLAAWAPVFASPERMLGTGLQAHLPGSRGGAGGPGPRGLHRARERGLGCRHRRSSSRSCTGPPFYRIGKHNRWKRSEVMAWFDAHLGELSRSGR
jgi:hypothetical protein